MKRSVNIRNMKLDAGQSPEVREEIATGPSEPYTLDWNLINWN